MSDCNSLLAFAIGSGSIGVIDAFSRRLVRVIQGAHKADPTALDFSPDGKWLVSADCAGYIKVNFSSNPVCSVKVEKFYKLKTAF